ncbi:DNA-binding transcriptional repressor ArsR [Raoultella planticola]|uniref:DNA-binding transcriptional repressor ArsR n=1 Tax=Raoultella planticola TaxID=575 RepID=A0A485CPK7_RAOPL|nr:DNA-binding transcriptional repressor ArsR [Raoultella planticola]
MPHPLEVFKILSDATRLTIVMLLREQGELCVCDICAVTAESQPQNIPSHGDSTRGRAGS